MSRVRLRCHPERLADGSDNDTLRAMDSSNAGSPNDQMQSWSRVVIATPQRSRAFFRVSGLALALSLRRDRDKKALESSTRVANDRPTGGGSNVGPIDHAVLDAMTTSLCFGHTPLLDLLHEIG